MCRVPYVKINSRIYGDSGLVGSHINRVMVDTIEAMVNQIELVWRTDGERRSRLGVNSSLKIVNLINPRVTSYDSKVV